MGARRSACHTAPALDETAMPTPDTVYACLDGLNTTAAVVEGACWAAQRLSAPLTLLHTLERPEPTPPVGDYSGVLGMGAQDLLLQRLSALDEERAQITQQAAQRMLDEARKHVCEGSVPPMSTMLRQGDLTDVLLTQEPTARLFVLGSNRRPPTVRKLRLDHRIETAVRNLRQPVMVMDAVPFVPPTHFVVAYDGSATADAAVQRVAGSPLLRGMPAELVMVGECPARLQERLRAAKTLLEDAGFATTTRTLPGLPEEVVPPLLESLGSTLLVLGAYGHSRIRHFIVGSTTTALLRLCSVPVLVLR